MAAPILFDQRPAVFAAYRVLVPLPVSVDWPSGKQTLRITPSKGVAGADVELGFEGLAGNWPRIEHCRGTAHARHMYANCRHVAVPSIEHTFLERLVREGRAERLAGKFCRLTGPTYRPQGPDPLPDNYFGWTGPIDLL